MSNTRRTLLFLFLLGLCVSILRADEKSPLDGALRPLVERDKVTVVHTWAPWCPNCRTEMANGGWAGFITAHPEIDFVFVEIWNNGADSVDFLTRYGIGEQPNFQRLVDPGARSGPEQTKTLLGQPLTWMPSTWVYHKGRVRYALLYGEIRFDLLDQLLADTTADW